MRGKSREPLSRVCYRDIPRLSWAGHSSFLFWDGFGRPGAQHPQHGRETCRRQEQSKLQAAVSTLSSFESSVFCSTFCFLASGFSSSSASPLSSRTVSSATWPAGTVKTEKLKGDKLYSARRAFAQMFPKRLLWSQCIRVVLQKKRRPADQQCWSLPRKERNSGPGFQFSLLRPLKYLNMSPQQGWQKLKSKISILENVWGKNYHSNASVMQLIAGTD